ncbi:App1 family protein [Hymenobacter baengnokdamensis]|uniref:App1 family protein n=1 Tax=Hymenobacter baengnokdamensis TaxID=2615203 RepID=UPI001248C152|nr:phosphatase domain-containing protein [Hymenobacter baengnokdamensis]
MNLGQWLADAFEWTDAGMTRVAARLGRLRPLHLDVYRSYGTPHRFYVKGRLLADRGLTPQTEADSPWRNFQAMYRRFNSREIPGAEVVISLPQHLDLPVVTGPTGYFTLRLDPPALPASVNYLWYPVTVRLTKLPTRFRGLLGQVEGVAQVLIPPPTAEFGVISDLDDTVIVTRATHILRMLRTVLLRNAHSHETLAGVAAFYQALLHGQSGRPDNPFFYVSSSPWNLYDVLDDFLRLQGVPPGPLLLRETLLGRTPGSEGKNPDASPHHGHKLKEINQVLDTYPDLPFILLGDSGQQDPVIYAEVVRTYPGRIRVIYIRDVGVPARARHIGPLAAALRRDTGVELLLVPDYLTAATHAAAHGFITAEALAGMKSPE